MPAESSTGRAGILNVRFEDGNYIKLTDSDLVFDVAYWKVGSGSSSFHSFDQRHHLTVASIQRMVRHRISKPPRAHIQMNANNAVNFVGGTTQNERTKQGGGGRDWVINGNVGVI